MSMHMDFKLSGRLARNLWIKRNTIKFFFPEIVILLDLTRLPAWDFEVGVDKLSCVREIYTRRAKGIGHTMARSGNLIFELLWMVLDFCHLVCVFNFACVVVIILNFANWISTYIPEACVSGKIIDNNEYQWENSIETELQFTSKKSTFSCRERQTFQNVSDFSQ